MRIAIALFEGVEELDFAGPWEVLSYWAREVARTHVEVVTVAATLDPPPPATPPPATPPPATPSSVGGPPSSLVGGPPSSLAGVPPIRAAKGLRVLPDQTLHGSGPVDVFLMPGGRGTRTLLGADEPLHTALRTMADGGTLMTSVCTGALVYAAAGLLHGRPATTYWSSFDELLALDPSISPRPDDRFVDDGDVITAAGVSAGIDMALHLVVRLDSAEAARHVRRGIQYDPEPPV